jgi:hypothetical protein
MNFMQWLNSLDELLYEVVSWLLFFPLTLARVIQRPVIMMEYAQAQLLLPEDKQYLSSLSPPIFLVLSLLLSHAAEMSAMGVNPIIKSNHGLAGLVSDNFSLLLLRVIIFSIFPLVLAAYATRLQPGGLDRDTLRGPFYAQCYITAPVLLLLSLGNIALEGASATLHLAGLAAFAAAAVFYLAVQSAWLAHQLGIPVWRGALHAGLAGFGTLVLVLAIMTLFSI